MYKSGWSFLPHEHFLPHDLPGRIQYIDANLLGKLLDKLRIEHAQRRADLFAQLVRRAGRS